MCSHDRVPGPSHPVPRGCCVPGIARSVLDPPPQVGPAHHATPGRIPTRTGVGATDRGKNRDSGSPDLAGVPRLSPSLALASNRSCPSPQGGRGFVWGGEPVGISRDDRELVPTREPARVDCAQESTSRRPRPNGVCSNLSDPLGTSRMPGERQASFEWKAGIRSVVPTSNWGSA